MIIREINGEIINTKKVYIHDDVLLSLDFCRQEKEMNLKFIRYNDSKKYIMRFSNVIGFTMTACDFWGASECILDFEYISLNKRILIPELQKKHLSISNLSNNTLYDSCMETLFTFSSGDQLRIACETIEIID